MVYVFCLDGIKAWALKDIGFVSISYSVSDFYSVPSPNLVLLVIHHSLINQHAQKLSVKISIKKFHHSPVWNLENIL